MMSPEVSAAASGSRFEYADLVETDPIGARLYMGAGAGVSLLVPVLGWYLPFSIPAMIATVAACWALQAVVLHILPTRIPKLPLQLANAAALGGACWGLLAFAADSRVPAGIPIAFCGGVALVVWRSCAAGRIRTLLLVVYAALAMTVVSWVLVVAADSFPEFGHYGFRSLFLGPLVWIAAQFTATITGWGRGLAALVAGGVGQYGIGLMDLGAVLGSGAALMLGGVCILAFFILLGAAALWPRQARAESPDGPGSSKEPMN